MKGALIILPVILAFSSCDLMKEHQLAGSWQAAGVLEDGMPLDIDPAEIQFRFFENGLYIFKSTLSYREAGTFKMEGNLLYTLDTLNEASSEKVVKVTNLTTDSLFIQMNAEGRERLIKLFRKNND